MPKEKNEKRQQKKENEREEERKTKREERKRGGRTVGKPVTREKKTYYRPQISFEKSKKFNKRKTYCQLAQHWVNLYNLK
jgi:hypothetical protein